MKYFIILFKAIFVSLITITLMLASTVALTLAIVTMAFVLLKLLGDMLFKDAKYWMFRSKHLKKRLQTLENKN